MSDSHGDPFALAGTAGDALVRRIGIRPDVAVVLGSGWQDAVDAIGETVEVVDLETIPGFAPATALGHRASVRRVDVAIEGAAVERPVAVFEGRSHLYEGHDPAAVAHAVRTASAAGARLVVLTNAAGTLVETFQVGRPVLISDHLNMTGRSPLTGDPPPPPRRSRFVDLTDLYSSRLRGLVRSLDPSIGDGVYAGLAGPHFETPAEIRAYRSLGADVLGMSTVLEAIAARHLGMEVLGISLVTNLCAGMQAEVDDQEVIEAGRAASPMLGGLIRSVLSHPDL